jgi:hypothetical protein
MTNPELYLPCQCGSDCGKMVYQNPKSSIKQKIHQSCQYRMSYDKKSKSKNSFFTGKKTVEKKKKGGIDDQLDDAWSLLVKIKAGFKCEYCGNTQALNSHHLSSRAKMTVRWDLNNGISLCVNHHIGNEFSAHKTSIQFTMWLIRYKGQKFMDDLQWKANQTSHYSPFEKELILKELLEEIKKVVTP